MIFDKLFNIFRSEESIQQPDLKFGRYSDSFKSKIHHDHWTNSKELFEKQDYQASYKAFLEYIKDENEDNIRYSQNNGELEFEVFQGSKRIHGKVYGNNLMAEVKVVRLQKRNVPLMRRLMEVNYNLRYCRFCIENDLVYLKFNSNLIDVSPEKLYFAMRELATKADKFDDLLLDEFPDLIAIDNSHIIDLSEEQKRIKYEFLQKWLSDTIDQANVYQEKSIKGLIPYLLLSLAYRIDYLIVPQGKLMSLIEKVHISFYSQEVKSLDEKNADMLAAIKEMQALKQAEVFKELYRVKGTFGLTKPTSHLVLGELIREEKKNADWYQTNGQIEAGRIITEYSIMYSLFYYGMHRPTRLLMHMLGFMLHADYFKALGFSNTFYDPESKNIDKKKLESKIAEINKEALKQYPNFYLSTNFIKYDNLEKTVNSILDAIPDLNYNLGN